MAKKKKIVRQVQKGRIYIHATYNNTIITVSDEEGKPIIVGSCGMCGFSGTRKSTPYAATVAVQTTLKKAQDEYGLSRVSIYLKGIGPGRNASLRAIKAMHLDIGKIVDITPIPHNGVRPPKPKSG